MTDLDPRTTALILIDLQRGIAGRDCFPRSAEAVIATDRALADRFRAAGAPVVLVHVGWRSRDEMPSTNVDEPMPIPVTGTPPEFYAFVAGLQHSGDIVVMKHHWGAFTGTDLDLQLRRRGIRTVVIAGIATNFGVESTARSAWETGYDVVIVEDGCTSTAAELHAFAIKNVFPRIARVVAAAAVTLSG